MKKVVYFIMKRVAWITVHSFFSKVEIVGAERIPRGRPLIFTPNHQNAFLDAFVVGSISPVGIHYLTRSDVFNNPFRWFMDALQMMPIYRIRDGFGQLSQNAGVFEACRKLFSQDKSVLMFPEGNHGEHHFLRSLSKGTARLAFESQEILSDKEIWIQPVGLNYFDLRRPGRKMSIVFGEPIRLNDHMPAYHEHKAKALLQFRTLMAERMKDCMMIPDQDEHFEARVSHLTRANESMKFPALKKYLQGATEPAPAPNKVPFLRYLGQLLGWINFPPLYVISSVLKSKVKDIVFTSSIKWAIGMILFPIWWLLMYTTIALISGAQLALIVTLSAIVLLFIRRDLLQLADP
ncbi:MAG: 1-acyl-sn-glycerol-3-phosphate acyltransferase [Bacteroidota bacterium]